MQIITEADRVNVGMTEGSHFVFLYIREKEV